MLHFVTSYINQNKKRKQTHEIVQYGLEITFKVTYSYLYFVTHREKDRIKKKASKIKKKSENLNLK